MIHKYILLNDYVKRWFSNEGFLNARAKKKKKKGLKVKRGYVI